MFGLFERRVLYLKLFEEHIEVRDIKTKRTISRKAQLSYSNERLLISNFQNAETEIRAAIDLLSIRHKRFNRLVFVLQPFHARIKEYSEVEYRTFVDSAAHAGATEVYLYTEHDDLSDQKIFKEAKFKSTFFEEWSNRS